MTSRLKTALQIIDRRCNFVKAIVMIIPIMYKKELRYLNSNIDKLDSIHYHENVERQF